MKTVLTFTACLLAASTLYAQKFEWAKSFGAIKQDKGASISVDAFGNVYTTGSFGSTVDFDPSIPAVANLTASGLQDIFIHKLDHAGNFLWVKSFGGNVSDEGLSITVDAVGNTYTTGYFQGIVDFDPGPATYNLTSGWNTDIFVLKLDSSGNFLWAKSFGGGPEERGTSITVDTTGNVYITGSFKGTVDFDPGAATNNLTATGTADVFILKLDTSGNFIWAKSIGGNSIVNATSISIDTLGNVYTVGLFLGTADFDPGAASTNLTSAGMADIFVVKLDASGNLIWVKSFGGSSHDVGFSITVDAHGSVYTTGTFEGTADFDPGPATFNLTSVGLTDFYILKLDSSGIFMWATSFGTNLQDFALSINHDDSGNIYTTGLFSGTVDFDPGPAINNLTPVGQSDIFLQKLDASGNFIWAKSFGGSGSGCIAYSITLDPLGNIYTTGLFENTGDFDPGTGVEILRSRGGQDVFIQKMSPCSVDMSTSTSGVTITANNTAATYQWLNCDSNYAAIAGEIGQSFTATVNGNYAVEITENGCVDTSACVAITSVGMTENTLSESIHVFPNPSAGTFTIDLGSTVESAQITITDVTGRIVESSNHNATSSVQITLNEPSGIYFIEVVSGEQKSNLKLIVE